jgi:D-galactarolactone cycloisomerase
MKITRVEPIIVSVPYSYGGDPGSFTSARWPKMDTLLVKIETDDGVTGWGEGFGFSAVATTKTAIETLVAPLCIGRDAADITGLSNELQRRLHTFGRNGPLLYAISAIDIALWDIAGQVARLPLYRLLGGDATDAVPAYASLLRYDDPVLVARNAAQAIERGYRQIKLHEINVPEVEAARRAVGAVIPLMLDTNCRWPPEDAAAHAKRMEPFDLMWIEEPVWPPEDYARLGEVARATAIPIAAGENHATLTDFEQLIDVGVGYVQPSVTKVGGITEMRNIIALATARGARVAPHSPYFGPGLVATAHLCASLAKGASCEQFYCTLEARPFDGGMSASNGWVRLPEGPGLGVAVDETVISRYRVG